MKPQPLSDLDLAFPAIVKHLLPTNDPDWPKYRKDWHGLTTWAQKLFSDAFYRGLTDLKLKPKTGIDPDAAWRHIRAIMGSFEPKHEDKNAACHLLLEAWFEGAEWTTAKKP